MNIDNIFTCCVNVSHDALFNVYSRYEDFRDGKHPELSLTYEVMTSEETKLRVVSFFVHDDGDTVDVLIYKR